MPGSAALKAARSDPAMTAWAAASRGASSIRWQLGLSTGSVVHYRNWWHSSPNCTRKASISILQGIDTATPAGKAMFQMMGVFAEFECAMIVERVKSGLARARSQGKRLGRRPVSEDVVERIRERLGTGRGILRVAKELG